MNLSKRTRELNFWINVPVFFLQCCDKEAFVCGESKSCDVWFSCSMMLGSNSLPTAVPGVLRRQSWWRRTYLDYFLVTCWIVVLHGVLQALTTFDFCRSTTWYQNSTFRFASSGISYYTCESDIGQITVRLWLWFVYLTLIWANAFRAIFVGVSFSFYSTLTGPMLLSKSLPAATCSRFFNTRRLVSRCHSSKCLLYLVA